MIRNILDEHLGFLTKDRDDPSPNEAYTCVECENKFSLTSGELDFFVQHDLEMPKRCKRCRLKRKQQSSTATRQVTESPQVTASPRKHTIQNVITCDNCGKESKVPFRPIPGRAVYCKICWNGVRNI